MKHLLFALIAGLTISASSFAETFSYRAVEDFESLDEGTVPYYIHNQEEALAINAANSNYREKFARAITYFKGSAGEYDVTITALGELDGECEYRFLVNGEVVGTAVNSRVTKDYTELEHVFNNVVIPADAEIAVESNSVTNGLIPEGDITAYARGRWRTLTIETAAVAVADPADISIAASASTTTPAINTEYVIRLDVRNNSADQTATAPQITMAIPANTTIAPHALCTVDGNNVSCALSEISAGSTTTLTLSATTTTAGSAIFNASVSADQSDDNTDNNTASVEMTVTDTATLQPQEPVNVDLALSVNSNTASATSGQAIEYRLTVLNQHPDNTATAPMAGAALPPGLEFTSSADCSADGQAVNCQLPELAPAQTTTVVFSALATSSGTAEIVASVSANESETSTTNNEVRYSVVVAENTTESTSETQTKIEESNGGSTDSRFLLMLLLMFLLRMALLRYATYSATATSRAATLPAHQQ